MGYATSNDERRAWYPECVIDRTTPTCTYSTCQPVDFASPLAADGELGLLVHPKAVEAFEALATVFRFHGYTFDESAGGTVNCRKITGGTDTSLHAHAIALDINPSRNGPYGTDNTDMLPQPGTDAQEIATNNGFKVFRWGRLYGDSMHWEINVHPNDLASGIDWSTVAGGEMKDERISDEMWEKIENVVNRLSELVPSHADPSSNITKANVLDNAVQAYSVDKGGKTGALGGGWFKSTGAVVDKTARNAAADAADAAAAADRKAQEAKSAAAAAAQDAKEAKAAAAAALVKARAELAAHNHPDAVVSFTLGKVNEDTAYLDHRHPKETITVHIDPPA